MKYSNLREFLSQLECQNELKRIKTPVSSYLEITEISNRVLQSKGPALLFEKVLHLGKHAEMPVLTNLFGTIKRITLGMGMKNVNALRKIGELLALLQEIESPKGLRDTFNTVSMLKNAFWNMKPKSISSAVCQEVILENNDVDLSRLPIQTCWPGDIGPLITWGLVITKNPNSSRQNLGIYRQQPLSRNKLILRWLPHRGGALDFYNHTKIYPGKPFPIVVALGVDPATMLSAVTPIPDNLSEYQFAGLLRSSRTQITRAIGNDLSIPASAEIILEGNILPSSDPNAIEPIVPKNICPPPNIGYEMGLEGPYGDHTGYYNEREWFPVFTIDRITMQRNPIYHSTYTGKPPDEPAILGLALNEIFIPLLRRKLPEIVDFYLPSEGCSYRLAIVSIRKQYIGHAKRVMFGLWSLLKQFMYTKFIIVVDEDIDPRNWSDVIWAIVTRLDPARDSTIVENTPIDYLDFASPTTGLGGKIGLDATNKWPGETCRTWGVPIRMDPNVKNRVNNILKEFDI